MSETISVFKVLNGKAQEIKNPIACLKISTLLLSNAASQSVQELPSDSEFVKLVTTGEGEFKVTVKKTNEAGETTTGVVVMAKKGIAAYFEIVKKIGALQSEASQYMKRDGEFGKRGRKPLTADYSEL